MKQSGLLFLLMAFCLEAGAQQFQFRNSVALPAGTAPSGTAWIDADNDSLLDVLVADTSASEFKIIIASGFVKNNVVFHTAIRSTLRTGAFAFTDLNGDDKMDIVLTGVDANGTGTTETWLNQGNFSFVKSPASVASVAGTKIGFADFNLDGTKDAVIQRISSSWLLQKNSHSTFTTAIDSVSSSITDFSIFDFDGNGYPDIALSGIDKSLVPFLTVIEFEAGFKALRTINVPVSFAGHLVTGDLDHDGYFDLILSGKNPSGTGQIISFMNRMTTFTAAKNYPAVSTAYVHIADFTSDGKADVLIMGDVKSGILFNRILTFEGDSIDLSSRNVLYEAPGDYDRDGDLDIVQISDTSTLVLTENRNVPVNKGPLSPGSFFGASFLKHLFLYWDKSGDDHTPSAAITYDLTISDGLKSVETGDVDKLHNQRLTVTHGDTGTNNFVLLDLNLIAPAVQIQPVDNAYVPSADDRVYGSTPGSGSFSICPITQHTVTVCNDSTIVLSAGAPAMWFSFTKGYTGTSNTYALSAVTDTVFSFQHKSSGCPVLTIYFIERQPPFTTDTLRTTICYGKPISLSVSDEWENVVWKRDGVFAGSGNTYNYISPILPKDPMTFVVTGNNEHGCHFTQVDIVTPSVPVLHIANPDYEISPGQQVQLTTSGDGTFLWSPADGLDNPASASPLASPQKNTLYTVTLTDSVGCTITGVVNVVVDAKAFIPDMFSPNGDGRNDELKLYGLLAPSQFKFTVFNREGAVVYETSDIATITTQGWNGSHNGSPQSPGIYFWKVEGKTDNGELLHLNGKKQGSVMLVR